MVQQHAVTLAGPALTETELEELVVRMAKDNIGWGYDRIVGALANLGYTLSDETVGNILRRHGIPTCPGAKAHHDLERFHSRPHGRARRDRLLYGGKCSHCVA